MTAGVMIAAAAAARERADVLQRFRLADATASDRAQSLDSLGLQSNGFVGTLMAAGVIMPGSRANRVYLNEGALIAYEQRTARRGRLALAAAACIALALGLAVMMFGFFLNHPPHR